MAISIIFIRRSHKSVNGKTKDAPPSVVVYENLVRVKMTRDIELIRDYLPIRLRQMAFWLDRMTVAK